MKWPWTQSAKVRDQLAKAEAQAIEAQAEYAKTVQSDSVVSDVLRMFFYHAEKNRIVENIQKVARGH